jgi:hypothetical protein
VFQGGVGPARKLRRCASDSHTAGVVVFLSVLLSLLLALPWLVAIVLLTRRDRSSLLWSDNGRTFPTQATVLRSFRGS